MNKLLSLICLAVGLALMWLLLPMYDLMVTKAMVEGGLLAVATFIIMLLIGGVTFIILAVVLWRR